MKDLILNTPRHSVQASLTQAQRDATVKAIEYLMSEITLGVLVSNDEELKSVLQESLKAIKEAK